MPQLTLEQAQTIVATSLRYGTDHRLQPLAVAVLDARGVLKAFAAQDGTSLRRYEIAQGKACWRKNACAYAPMPRNAAWPSDSSPV